MNAKSAEHERARAEQARALAEQRLREESEARAKEREAAAAEIERLKKSSPGTRRAPLTRGAKAEGAPPHQGRFEYPRKTTNSTW